MYNYGWLRDYPDFKDYCLKSEEVKPFLLKEDTSLPSSYDICDLIEMPRVQNQGNLGSCTAHAAAYMYSIYLRLAGKRAEPLSRLFLYKATRDLLGLTGDTGAHLRNTMQAMVTFGVPPEKYYPYIIDKFDEIPPPHIWSMAKEYQALKYWRLDPSYRSQEVILDNIKTNIRANRACIFGFMAYDSIDSETGNVKMPDNTDGKLGGHAACFTGDTKISMLDGTEISLEELSKTYSNGDSFWVYSCDKDGEIFPGKAFAPRKTKENAEIVEITLDNEEKVRCTSDHLFMLRDGSYRKAADLNPEDSLMPLYRQLSRVKGLNGYEKYYDLKSDKWMFTHRMNHKDGYKGEIHHADFNKRNNTPCNLVVMGKAEHLKVHQENMGQVLKYVRSEKGREKSRENMNKLWANEDWRRASLKRNKKNGKKVSSALLSENRCGFQAVDKEVLKANGSKNGKKNHHVLHKPDVLKKSHDSWKKRFKNDAEFSKGVRSRAVKNLKEYNEGISSGKISMTKKQKEARRKNAIALCQNKPLRKRAQQKTTYKRFYKDKYSTFEEYLRDKNIKLEPVNHKVVSVKKSGREDVYDMTVEKYHNFAISSGVFVHNCAVGYDDNYVISRKGHDDQVGAIKFINSFGKEWGINGYGHMPYQYILDNMAVDWWTMMNAEWLDMKVFA